MIESILVPGGWDNEKPFVTCASMDGTKKNLLNCIIAGLKVAKLQNQNGLFKVNNIDTEKRGIHSETFYIPLVGALCKETKENSHKYFAIFFTELRDIEKNGIKDMDV